jgi:hypothetical protein
VATARVGAGLALGPLLKSQPLLEFLTTTPHRHPNHSLADVKASVNWMYAAKMGSEGAAMYEAACALR